VQYFDTTFSVDKTISLAFPARQPTPEPLRNLTRTRGVRGDVLNPIGAAPALGHQPEGIPVQAIAHRRAPRLPGTPPGRLQQGVAGRRET
jgi:hypothetical protein